MRTGAPGSEHRPAGLPPFPAEHEAALATLWERLAAAARNRRSPWHTPVIASSVEGEGRARVMVLRAADAASRTLRLHTDARAAKVAELGVAPVVELLFYDGPSRLQLRARGSARIDRDGPITRGAWEATRPFSRRCYLAPQAPGTETPVPSSGLPPDLERREPTLPESDSGRANFAAMLVEVTRLEWLHLAHDGHLRGVLDWNGAAWRGRWLLP